jgi:hypothetical protein
MRGNGQHTRGNCSHALLRIKKENEMKKLTTQREREKKNTREAGKEKYYDVL